MLTELKARTEEKLTDIAVQCMKAALSLVLYTTQQLSASKSDDHFADCKPYTSIDKQDIFVSVQQILSEWISAVLGSGEIKAKKPKTEMEVNKFFFIITGMLISNPVCLSPLHISIILEALAWDPFSGLPTTT